MRIYPFSNEFLTRLLSLIFKDPSFGLRIVLSIDSALLQHKAFQHIFSVSYQICRTIRRPPSPTMINQVLYQRYESGQFTQDMLHSTLKIISKAETVRPIARDEAVLALKDAVLDISLGDALRQSLRCWRAREFDQIRDLVESSFSKARSLDLGEIEQPLSISLEDYLTDIAEGKAMVRRMPTGIYELDVKLKGGLGRGELGCVMGARKGGKSAFLVFVATTSILCGLNVAYITCELKRLDVKNRITAALTGEFIDDIAKGGRRISKRLREKLSRVLSSGSNDTHRGDYVVKYFPPKSATVSDIEAYLSDLGMLYNFSPDVLIIDYADELKASSSLIKDNYTRIDDIYADLKAIGSSGRDAYSLRKGFDCSVWTASQVQRDAMNNEILKIDVLDKSIEKASKVDLALAVCQTEEEAEANMARIYNACCRFASGNSGIDDEYGPYSRDLGRARLFDVIEVEQERSIEQWRKSLKGNLREVTGVRTTSRTLIGMSRNICGPIMR